MEIDADFDSGNIRVLDADDPRAIELALQPDGAAPFMQWFHFRVRGAAGEPLRLRIGNAGEATYAAGFADYRAVASVGDDDWLRVPTRFADGALTIEHTPDADEIFYACFAPYPFARAAELVERAAAHDLARVATLGESLDGRPIEAVILGEGPRRAWIVARQHPGEPHGSWFVEAAIDRLLDDDELASALRDRFTFHLVPMMNPDGVARGHHRTNAAGVDLNRAYRKGDRAACPEAHALRRALLDGGVDLFLDVHGDEEIPYVFAGGCEGNPSYTARLAALEESFLARLAAVDPDFQRAHGYPPDRRSRSNLTRASNWVGHRFQCLSLTLEMPFRDNADRPDWARGFSPARCASFAVSTLTCMLDDDAG